LIFVFYCFYNYVLTLYQVHSNGATGGSNTPTGNANASASTGATTTTTTTTTATATAGGVGSVGVAAVGGEGSTGGSAAVSQDGSADNNNNNNSSVFDGNSRVASPAPHHSPAVPSRHVIDTAAQPSTTGDTRKAFIGASPHAVAVHPAPPGQPRRVFKCYYDDTGDVAGKMECVRLSLDGVKTVKDLKLRVIQDFSLQLMADILDVRCCCC
jgi:hypothetical protein